MRQGMGMTAVALLAVTLVASADAVAETARHGWQMHDERHHRWASDHYRHAPRRGERTREVRPRVEVVIPLELLTPAPHPGVPASPETPAIPDEPLVLDCRGLAERIESLRDSHTVGTRQLRERRELEARYRRACQ
ncbi:hypothetical protein SAMN05192555_103295 [Franzmannia pantelleriensis]|uniref:Secreted protein n=1 Tax=Franzmannia pantelleriensis TaxID=48727 RepID=A0A1G9IVM9_9GAMM|nr:hypothetical protein [Halomonas pantelleriensis]SDL29328.1 hypothetical protein SAMN05192555_103295 [Halomonas pantelleriensis]